MPYESHLAVCGRMISCHKSTIGMMRHGPFPGLGSAAGHRPLEQLPTRVLLENKMAVQATEIERLATENQRLASAHVALRRELLVAQQERQRLQAHIGSIQTESDIQIRVLLEKITKMDASIQAGMSAKKDLQQAHIEAQSLVTARQELTTQIQQTTQELQKAHSEVKKLPEMHVELDSLRQEHQRLRAAFEYEKGLNIEQVEQMQAMEKNLIAMAREVEKLRAEVLNAEKRSHAPNPYGGTYGNPDPSYPPAVQGSGIYIDGYGRPQVQMGVSAAGEGTDPHGSGATIAAGYGGGAVVSAGANGVWGGSYDAIRGAPSSLAQR
ncbi:hypothetical protein HHK36_013747 [Tetracentron sinense]|uniref:Protein FLX-like 4 n=1 Tax=Tetracentron sinense TaxID=13715 RepID=A0A834Z2N5_TETSI|nr:hypothetical protein HHK36_013747 [Tetracentron sinense]